MIAYRLQQTPQCQDGGDAMLRSALVNKRSRP